MSTLAFGSFRENENRVVVGGVELYTPALRVVSSSGFKPAVGAARVDVTAARTQAVMAVVFILLVSWWFQGSG